MIWAVAAVVFFLDQLSKFFAVRCLNPDESLAIIKDIFYLTLVRNTGAAFGIFKGATFFFIAIAIFAILAIIVYIRKAAKTFFLNGAALGLILGGALGNLADRLRFGHVIDFLDFRIWPVFNVADSAVTIGAILLIISLLTKHSKP
ncbi:unnamed protein product [marine sediment metagenome]|uniref:Lipoprotein signal peptidase n=1 Tax=marine sediment metagenome TaxID=412755 RepID=X0VL15_9ZZZZ